MSRPRKPHLELLRIIAVFLVVLTHTGRRGYTYFTTLEPSAPYYLAMLIPVLCKIAVPLFYMISGAVLIDRDELPSEIWRYRIRRHLAVLVVATLGMYLYYGFQNGTPMSVGDLLRTLYSRNVIIPYWFLYSYLGYLIMLPFLRRMIRGMSDKEFVYLFCLYAIFNGIIPMAQYRLWQGSIRLNGSLDVALVTSDLVLYPAAGSYLEKHALGRRQLIFLWLAAALAVGATLYMTHYKIRLSGQLEEGQVGTFYGSLCMIPAMAVYATVKRLRDLPAWFEKLVVTVGPCTFGIYLTEQIIREQGYPVRDVMCRYIPELLATMIYVGLVVLVGFGLTWSAKHLPGLSSSVAKR